LRILYGKFDLLEYAKSNIDMNYVTEPRGKFIIQVPLEWQYKNVAIGFEETSPFGFQLYENEVGALQISCY
jgi:hypothetical protein